MADQQMTEVKKINKPHNQIVENNQSKASLKVNKNFSLVNEIMMSMSN